MPAEPSRQLERYERMYLIRRVEERLIDEYASRRIRMAIHLSIGQEAVAVGVLDGSRRADTVIGTHRCHAVYLAKGGDAQAMVDELYSLPTGCSGGVGGSMHLAAPDVGMLGSSAVLGGGLPISVGGAHAHAWRGDGDVAFAFTGDGGIDEGVFWECLNLAAVRRLPVVFVVENNDYSTLTPQRARQASTDVVAKGEAFGVRSVRVDGNDVEAVAGAVADVLPGVRAGEGPVLIEAVTFRYVAHVGPAPDWGTGRPEIERSGWPACDPLVVTEGQLPGEPLDEVRARVDRSVDEVFRRAIDAFEETNAIAGLVAPPPPNAAAV